MRYLLTASLMSLLAPVPRTALAQTTPPIQPASAPSAVAGIANWWWIVLVVVLVGAAALWLLAKRHRTP